MKSDSLPAESDSLWIKTPFANLVRYKPSQTYFARLRVKGKLIRHSLKTTTLSVAKLRLADLEKTERGFAASREAVAEGKMTFGDCLNVFKAQVENDPKAKPNTKEYYRYRIKALLETWPELTKNISKVSNGPLPCLIPAARVSPIAALHKLGHCQKLSCALSTLSNRKNIVISRGKNYHAPRAAPVC